jgi:hypothetical protein
MTYAKRKEITITRCDPDAAALVGIARDVA